MNIVRNNLKNIVSRTFSACTVLSRYGAVLIWLISHLHFTTLASGNANFLHHSYHLYSQQLLPPNCRSSSQLFLLSNAPINVKLLGGRPGIGGGFELRSFFLFKCPTPGTLSLVKRVQIPHPLPPPEKGQGIGQTRIKIGIYRNYKVKKARNSNFKM